MSSHPTTPRKSSPRSSRSDPYSPDYCPATVEQVRIDLAASPRWAGSRSLTVWTWEYLRSRWTLERLLAEQAALAQDTQTLAWACEHLASEWDPARYLAMRIRLEQWQGRLAALQDRISSMPAGTGSSGACEATTGSPKPGEPT